MSPIFIFCFVITNGCIKPLTTPSTKAQTTKGSNDTFIIPEPVHILNAYLLSDEESLKQKEAVETLTRLGAYSLGGYSLALPIFDLADH